MLVNVQKLYSHHGQKVIAIRKEAKNKNKQDKITKKEKVKIYV